MGGGRREKGESLPPAINPIIYPHYTLTLIKMDSIVCSQTSTYFEFLLSTKSLNSGRNESSTPLAYTVVPPSSLCQMSTFPPSLNPPNIYNLSPPCPTNSPSVFPLNNISPLTHSVQTKYVRLAARLSVSCNKVGATNVGGGGDSTQWRVDGLEYG